jgi:hypothetical protein
VQTVLENAFRHCLCLTNNSTSTSKVHWKPLLSVYFVFPPLFVSHKQFHQHVKVHWKTTFVSLFCIFVW